MNRHFEDSTYYARRAGETMTAGVAEELDHVRTRVASMVGRSPEPEMGRMDALRTRFDAARSRVGRGVREATSSVRGRLGQGRRA